MAPTQTMQRKAKKPEQESVPTTMRAAAIDHYGGPEVLILHELPVPKAGVSEVLIAVHTAGVGGWDADIREGWNPGGRVRFPLVLGTDGSGTIAQLGPRTRRSTWASGFPPTVGIIQRPGFIRAPFPSPMIPVP